MKKVHFFCLFLIFAAFAVSLQSCEELEVGEELFNCIDSLRFGPAEQTKVIPIVAPAKWSATTEAEWLTLTPKDTLLTILVSANPDSCSRRSTILLKAGKQTHSIDVIQTGQGGELTDDEIEINYTLSDNTTLLDEDIAALILTYKEPEYGTNYGSFTISKSADESKLPKEGQNIIINTPNEVMPDGLLARCNYVRLEGNSYYVSYTRITLEEAFENLQINTPIDLSPHVQRIVAANGREVPIRKAVSTNKYHVDISFDDIELGLGFGITPAMALDILTKLQLVINDHTLSTFNFVVDCDFDLSAEVALGIMGSEHIARYPLLTIFCGAIPVGPIVITPAIEVSFVWGAEAGLNLTATVHYKQSARSQFHYDEVAGFEASYKTVEKEGDGFSIDNIGAKLSGKLSYGLGVGPSLSLYGYALTLNTSASFLLTEEFSRFVDLTHKSSNTDTWINQMEYKSAFEVGGYATLRTFGKTLGHINTPTISFPIESRSLVPHMSKIWQIKQDGERFTYTTYVKGKSLFYPPIRLGASYERGDTIYADLTLPNDVIDQLEEGADSVEISTQFIVPQGKIFDFLTHHHQLFGMEWEVLYQSLQYQTMFGLKKANEQALRGILKDIYSSAAGQWEGCFWSTDDEPISWMKNVKKHVFGPDSVCFEIFLPEEWRTNGTLTVGDHTGGSLPGFRWELSMNPNGRHFNEVTVEEPCCYELYVGEDVDRFTYHGKGGNGILLPDDANYLNLSKSNIKSFSLGKSTNQQKLEVVLDDCPKLDAVYITDRKIASLSTKNAPLCKYLYLTDASFSGARFSLNEGCNVIINSSNGEGFNWTDACRSLAIMGTHPSISVNGVNSLEVISVRGTVESLSVSNCPKLSILNASSCGLSSFDAANLPSINELKVDYNPNLTGVMLPVFDELYSRNSWGLSYDQRYFYNSDGSVRTDRGYGWYYQDEPARGYHRK